VLEHPGEQGVDVDLAPRTRPGGRGHRAAYRSGAGRGRQTARQVARPRGIGSGAGAGQDVTSEPAPSPEDADTRSWPSSAARASSRPIAASAITVPGG